MNLWIDANSNGLPYRRKRKILIPNITEGTYVVSETAAPEGYILDAVPQTVIVKSGKLTAVEFLNKPMVGLQIKKIDAPADRERVV